MISQNFKSPCADFLPILHTSPPQFWTFWGENRGKGWFYINAAICAHNNDWYWRMLRAPQKRHTLRIQTPPEKS